MKAHRRPFSLLLILFCNCSVTSSPLQSPESQNVEQLSSRERSSSKCESLGDSSRTSHVQEYSREKKKSHPLASSVFKDLESLQCPEREFYKDSGQMGDTSNHRFLKQLKSLNSNEFNKMINWTSEMTFDRSKVGYDLFEDYESLKHLIGAIYFQHLENCDLVIVADEKYMSIGIIDVFLHQSSLKQVLLLDEASSISDLVIWTKFRCKGVLILASQVDRLFAFINGNTIFSWDYKARVIIAGLSKEAYEYLCASKMCKKTEHIVGIIKNERRGQYNLYTHRLYGAGGLVLLTTWKQRSFTTEVNLFPDKISNLQQVTLNVIAFEWPPAIFYQRDLEGQVIQLYGRDPSVIKALAKAFNFTESFIEPHPDELWGVQLENGSYNGIVGLLGSGQGDMAIANLYLTALGGRSAFQELSSPFADDLSCYMSRVDPPLPRWQSLGLPFTWTTWVAILLGMLSVGPVFFVLERASVKNFDKSKYHSLPESSLYVIGLHFSNSLPTLPMCSSTRIFIGFLLLYCIIITTGYKSNLTAYLTISTQPSSMETFADLYKSGVRVLGFPFYNSSMSQSENHFLRALTDRFDNRSNFDEIKKEILLGQAVMINSKRYLEFVGAQVNSASGSPMVRIMQECFSPYTVGIAYQRNSPLKPKFDRAINSMFEQGLVQKWFLDSIDMYQKLRSRELKGKALSDEGDRETNGVIPLGMDHVQGVFIILAFGFLTATILFASEMLF